MLAEEYAPIARLLFQQRAATLATLADGSPYPSFVAYAAEPNLLGFLLHLSTLAPHTRQLKSDPRAALLVAEPDDRRENVQTLARITLSGQIQMIEPESPDYATARTRYLEHLPAAAMLFDFADFALYRLVPATARYIGGFARAYTLTPEQLLAASQVIY